MAWLDVISIIFSLHFILLELRPAQSISYIDGQSVCLCMSEQPPKIKALLEKKIETALIKR